MASAITPNLQTDPRQTRARLHSIDGGKDGAA
jgi:hypothetical protein